MQLRKTGASYRIAIIGVGPKGLYSFARLLSFVKTHHVRNVDIYLFEKSGLFGTGPIYNPCQPDYLLMNYENEHIDHSSLYLSDARRKTFIEFAKPIGKFSPRAQVGSYLKDLYDHLIEEAALLVNLYEIKEKVVSVEEEDNNYVIRCESTAGQPRHSVHNEFLKFDSVMFTTGHNTCESVAAKDFKTEITSLYPPDITLKSISKDDIVIVKGLGLTFIDAVLALTEGRGGQFIPKNGKFTYIRSGQEVQKIIPFSRSGQFMLPRATTIIPFEFQLKNQKLLEFSDQLNIDFENDILPELELELKLQCPLKNCSFIEALNFRKYDMLELIEIAEGRKSPEILISSMIWRRFSGHFSTMIKEGRVITGSVVRFQNYWKSKFQKLCYGPPLDNFKKVLAIDEIGILDLRFRENPNIDMNRNISNGPEVIQFSKSLDARIPSIDLRENPSRLFLSMLNNGLISISESQLSMGTLNLDQKGSPIKDNGKISAGITFYGIPTEGKTYNNDTLSISQNDFAEHWLEKIQNEIYEEFNEIESDFASLGEATN